MRLLLNTQLTHDEVDILTGVLDLIGIGCSFRIRENPTRFNDTPEPGVYAGRRHYHNPLPY